jgi:hypothetical protein
VSFEKVPERPSDYETLLFMLMKEDMNKWNRFYALSTANSIILATTIFGDEQFTLVFALGGIAICVVWFFMSAHGFIYGDFLHKRLTNRGVEMHDMFVHLSNEKAVDTELDAVRKKYGAEAVQLPMLGKLVRSLVAVITARYNWFRASKELFCVAGFIGCFFLLHMYFVLRFTMKFWGATT